MVGRLCVRVASCARVFPSDRRLSAVAPPDLSATGRLRVLDSLAASIHGHPHAHAHGVLSCAGALIHSFTHLPGCLFLPFDRHF
mmetsp:Transcript_48085/g.120419  ORF Transcript_48085/g.120419 Transcript_48085/m.120419 type:complete len:84 (-) Transcript_48085:510-761(-)